MFWLPSSVLVYDSLVRCSFGLGRGGTLKFKFVELLFHPLKFPDSLVCVGHFNVERH